MRLTPSEYLVHVFGNAYQASQAIGCHHGTIGRWIKNTQNGEKGLIPSYLHRTIIKRSNRRIKPADLIYGKSIRTK